jgi:hypothetical protein
VTEEMIDVYNRDRNKTKSKGEKKNWKENDKIIEM